MKNLKKKIPVGILGATGIVGQKFVELLTSHPWFEIVVLAASEKTQGKKYSDAVKWMMPSPIDFKIGNLKVQDCQPTFPCQIVFSALDSCVAGVIEEKFAAHGYIVISNASNHRLNSVVPLVIPEVNAEHLELIKSQGFLKGAIVTNPNCSVIGLTMALKPLVDQFGIEKVHVVTLQSISGAGYPGLSSLDIMDNVIPFIAGEEEKIESESLKVLGTFNNDQIERHDMLISAHCNRVAVIDGHMGCVSIKLKSPATFDEIIQCWNTFSGDPQVLQLPTSPKNPIIYLMNESHPQPKLHRHLNQGMVVSIGRLRKCPLFDWKFVLLSHNTIRGAAGCAILNAELMVRKDYIQN